MLLGSTGLRACGFAYPFLTYHVEARGYNVADVGVVLAALGAGLVVGQPLCGWLADRLGRRVTLVATMLLAATVLVHLASASSLLSLVIGAALSGVVGDAPRPIIAAIFGDEIACPVTRAKAEMWRLGWMGNVGSMVAFLCGGYLSTRVDTSVMFLLNATACVGMAAAAVFFVGGGRPAAAGERVPGRAGCLRALSDKRFVLLLASNIAVLTVFAALYASLPMLMGHRGFDAAEYGWVGAANAAAVIVASPILAPWLTRRVADRPRVGLMMIAAGWMTGSVALAGLVNGTEGFVVSAVGLGLAETVWFVLSADVLHRVAPAAQRGVYQGMAGASMALATVVTPLLTAASLDWGGPSTFAVMIMVIGGAGGFLCIPLARLMAVGSRTPAGSAPHSNNRRRMPSATAAARSDTPSFS